MLSSRLVLPCPLSPEKTWKRGAGSSSSGARLRTLRRCRARTRNQPSAEGKGKGRGKGNEALDAHGHHDAGVLLARDRTEQARVELALELEGDLVGGHGGEEIDHVAGVEADRHCAAGALGVSRLARLA